MDDFDISLVDKNNESSNSVAPKFVDNSKKSALLKCDECTKSFSNRKTLKQHIKLNCKGKIIPIHTIFKCCECSKEFLYNRNLTRHKKISCTKIHSKEIDIYNDTTWFKFNEKIRKK